MPGMTHFLVTHARLTQPDGRPLYAYRTSPDAYRSLLDGLRSALAARRDGGEFPAAFCLYAAETFRREHSGGPWAWQTIFQPLGVPRPAHPQLATWVALGLTWWHRPLLNNPNGRMLLLTIACEGGLPLRLLEQQDADLTRFFRMVLETYYRSGQVGPAAAQTIAGQQVQRLPLSLRQEPVLKLTGELIAGICDLQPLVEGVPDPITWLDAHQDGWRRTLPLRLDDQIAKRLLCGLIARTGELAAETRGQPRWIGELRSAADGWQVARRLDIPESLTATQITRWTGVTPDQPRLRLLLDTARGTEAVAWLTRGDGGQTPRYRREWLKRGGVVRQGLAVRGEHRLLMSDGQHEYPLATLDEDPWGPLPWLFIERASAGHWRWLAEGPARTRAERAMVVVPRGLSPADGTPTDGCTVLGHLTDLDCDVYAISGRVAFCGEGSECYRIDCGADEDSGGHFVLAGQELSLPGQGRRLFLGLPTFDEIDETGRRIDVNGRIEWRQVGDSGPWQPRTSRGQGQLWLRLLAPDGLERCRRQVRVLPRDFAINTIVGLERQPGSIRLSALAAASVDAFQDGRPLPVQRDADSASVLCSSLAGTLPAPVSISLHWPGSSPLLLTLPYPQRGAFFDLEGRPLPLDECIVLDRMAGLRVVIQDPGGGGYWLRIELFGAPFPPVQERLPPLAQGRLDSGLYRWQERITTLLASGGGLEDEVRLTVETSAGRRLAQARVSRFDAILAPDRERSLVRIPADSLARLGDGDAARVRVEMLRLWAPGDEALALAPCPDDPAAWSIPDGLDAGPWWVVARHGDWARFRPLLWSVPVPQDAPTATFTPLSAAIRQAILAMRRVAIKRTLAELASQPDSPDWLLLSQFIELGKIFPPTSLDPLCALVDQPRTLAQALLRADQQGFDGVWSLSAKLPFLWMLLPLEDWRQAAQTWFGWLRGTLADMESGDDLVFDLWQGFRERVTGVRPYWPPLCDWLQEWVFPDRPLSPNSDLNIARSDATRYERLIVVFEKGLMGRHNAEERWPTGSAVMDLMARTDGWMQGFTFANLAGFYRPVRCAPFVAAWLSRHGIKPDASVVYELRLLRAFDREWFDQVYAIALTIELARLPPTPVAP